MLGQPGQLKPGDRGHRQLVSAFDRHFCGWAHALGLGRPPLQGVGVQEQGGQGRSQGALVENRLSSSPTLREIWARRPWVARGPRAPTKRATVRPCLVISISSPPATSSSRASARALNSAAVICLAMWSVYRSHFQAPDARPRGPSPLFLISRGSYRLTQGSRRSPADDRSG